MTFLRSTARTLGRVFENAGRSRARRELLARSERSLADAGFSRALLESGNAAWPWRIESDESLTPLALSRSNVATGVPTPVQAVPAPRDDRDAWPETARKVA